MPNRRDEGAGLRGALRFSLRVSQNFPRALLNRPFAVPFNLMPWLRRFELNLGRARSVSFQ